MKGLEPHQESLREMGLFSWEDIKLRGILITHIFMHINTWWEEDESVRPNPVTEQKAQTEMQEIPLKDQEKTFFYYGGGETEEEVAQEDCTGPYLEILKIQLDTLLEDNL